MEVSIVWLAGGFRRFEAFAFAEVDSLKRLRWFSLKGEVGCLRRLFGRGGEKKGWEVWLVCLNVVLTG